MALYTHQITQAWQATGQTPVGSVIDVEGDTETNSNWDAGLGNTLNIAITKANVQSLCMFAASDVTLYTNTSGSNAINLLANNPLIWYDTSYYANPLAVDVTSFIRGADVAVQIRVLQDSTP